MQIVAAKCGVAFCKGQNAFLRIAQTVFMHTDNNLFGRAIFLCEMSPDRLQPLKRFNWTSVGRNHFQLALHRKNRRPNRRAKSAFHFDKFRIRRKNWFNYSKISGVFHAWWLYELVIVWEMCCAQRNRSAVNAAIQNVTLRVVSFFCHDNFALQPYGHIAMVISTKKCSKRVEIKWNGNFVHRRRRHFTIDMFADLCIFFPVFMLTPATNVGNIVQINKHFWSSKQFMMVKCFLFLGPTEAIVKEDQNNIQTIET